MAKPRARVASVSKKGATGLDPRVFEVPFSLGSGFLATRRGAHWALSAEENAALSAATAEVVNEIIPLIPAMDDNPLAAAITRLALALGTVVGTRMAMDYMIVQMAAQQQAAAAAAA